MSRLSDSSVFQARIRMSQPVWQFIAENLNPPELGRDPLQCHLDRLVRENPDAKLRILVTGDENVLDLLRDWCARMIAEGILMRSDGKRIEGGTLAAEATKVIALLDKHDAKMMQVNRAFSAGKKR